MFKVGLVEGRLWDEQRRDWSGSGPRPLRWTAWYPAADTAGVEIRLAGPPEAPQFIMGEVAPGACLNEAAERWPVVLVSHGTGGTAAAMGWLGCRLAAAGFIAIAVDHHGNTAVEPYLPEGFLCWWERARDLSVVLDLLDADGVLGGRLDLAEVFAAGFSLGGYTALCLAGAITDLDVFKAWLAQGNGPGGPREFPDIAEKIPDLLAESPEFRASLARHGRSYGDPRVKAVLALAPAPPVRGFTGASLTGMTIPVAIVVGRSDDQAPAEDCAVWLSDLLPRCELTLLGHGVGHYVFLCEATEAGRASEPIACMDPPGVDRAAIHDQAAETAVALFRSTFGNAG